MRGVGHAGDTYELPPPRRAPGNMQSGNAAQQPQQQLPQGNPPIQHLLSPQQSAQSDLIGASWSQESLHTSCTAATHGADSMLAQSNRPGSRSSSPLQRRLAEAMALEAKAAAAAGLRSREASSNASLSAGAGSSSRMLRAAAGEQRSRHRSPGRALSPSPRHADSTVPICAGVVGTPLSAGSAAHAEGPAASSNGLQSSSPASPKVLPRGHSGRSLLLAHQISISPQSSADWQPHSSSTDEQYTHHGSASRLLQQQQQQHVGEQPRWGHSPTAAVMAAFGDCRPAEQLLRSPPSSCFAGDSSMYGDHPSRGSTGGPGGELSFANSAQHSPVATQGGSGGSAGGAAGGGGQFDAAAGASSSSSSSFRMQPLAAGQHPQQHGNGSGGSSSELAPQQKGANSSSSQHKQGRHFKCCFVTTNSATASPAASGAGAAESLRGPHQTHPQGSSRLGGPAHSPDHAGGFGEGASPAQPRAHCAGMVPAGERLECRRDSGLGDEHSFCSAESVAATSWTGSCAGTDFGTAASFNGSITSGHQGFPLQQMPPPPLWASPHFPPPEGYLPVGVDEEQLSAHAHFAQRVKMLRMQAATAAAARGLSPRQCAEDWTQGRSGDDDDGCAGQQHGDVSTAQHSMQEKGSPRMGLMPPPAAAKGAKFSMPLRRQVLPEQQEGCGAAQEQQAEQEEACPAGMQGVLPGLSVKVKGDKCAPESPSCSAKEGDCIKAFFQDPSTYQPFAAPCNMSFLAEQLPQQAPPAVVMHVRMQQQLAVLAAGTTSDSGLSNSSSTPGLSNSSQRGPSEPAAGDPSEVSRQGLAASSFAAWQQPAQQGPEVTGQDGHCPLNSDLSSFDGPAGRLAGAGSPTPAADAALGEGSSASAARPSSPHRPLQVTAVPGSALYSKKVPDSRGGSPRFAPARFPSSPRRTVSPPPPAASAAAALATAKAAAATEAAEKAQSAADAAAAEARAAAARAAAARVYKASAAAVAEAVAEAEQDLELSAGSAGQAGSTAAQEGSAVAAAVQASVKAAGVKPSSKPSAKAAMREAKKAAACAAEASAAALAAEASAVEAATAAVVAAVAEEQASRRNSPRRQDRTPEASAATAAETAAAAAAALTAHAAAATDKAAPAEAAPQPGAQLSKAGAEVAPSTAAGAPAGSGPASAASKPASQEGQAGSGGGAGAPLGESIRARSTAWTTEGGTAGAGAPAAPAAAGGSSTAGSSNGSAQTAAGKEPAAKATAQAEQQQPSAGATTAKPSSSSTSSSPRKVLLGPTSSNSSSAGGGARTPKSYAAISAAKLGLKSPASTAGAKTAATRLGGSIPGQSSSTAGAATAAAAPRSNSTGKYPRAAASSSGHSSKGGALAVARVGSATGAGAAAAAAAAATAAAATAAASANTQALQSCPGSIALDMLKEAAEKVRASSSIGTSSSSGGIGSKLRAGSSTMRLDLDRDSSQEEAVSQQAEPACPAACGPDAQQAVGELPAQTAAAAAPPAPTAEGSGHVLPIEERILLKQHQLMQMMGLLKEVRPRSPSPRHHGTKAGSRNASPGRSNSPGLAGGRAGSGPRAAYVGLPLIGRRAASPPNARSGSPVSPRQQHRAASPQALAELAVPAYRKAQQPSSRTVSPEPSSSVLLEVAKAMRARSPERMARPHQAGSGKGGKPGSRTASPGKQKEAASSSRKASPAPLPRVATLLHAADAATSASAAVHRAATPPPAKRAPTPPRSAALQAAAGLKSPKGASRKAGAPAAVPAAAASTTLAAAGAVSPAHYKASSRPTSPLRSAGAVSRPAAPASPAAGASPRQLLRAQLSTGSASSKADSRLLTQQPSGAAAAANDDQAAKVVKTLVALDDLLPGLGGPEGTSTSNTASRASINELRSAAEVLLQNLQAGTQVPQHALDTILQGARRLSQQQPDLSPRSAAAAAGPGAATDASSAPAGAAGAVGSGSAKQSSAKLHALAQQLTALCQDMGAGANSSGSNEAGGSNAAVPKRSAAAAAAAKAAATAAVAAAAAMDAANRQTQRKEQRQRLKAAAAAAAAGAIAGPVPAIKLAPAQTKFPAAAAGAAGASAMPACQTPPAAGAPFTPLVTPLVMTSPFGQAAVQGNDGRAGAPAAVATNNSSSNNDSSSMRRKSSGPIAAMQAMLQEPAKAAAAALDAATTAAAAAAGLAAGRGLRLGRAPGTPKRRQPVAQKLLRMIASGRKGMVSKCHRLPSVAGSSSGGGCASPRVLTASAAASLPRSPLGLTPVTARQAHNFLKPQGLVSKHSSFRLLTPWLSSRPAASATVKQSPAVFYTQAFRASVGGPDVVVSQGARTPGGTTSAPGLARSASDVAKQLQQKAACAGKALSTGVAQSSEALRKLLRTSSSMSRFSHLSAMSYARTGEGNAEAADEETAGTAAPAISASDLHHAHQILSGAQLGAVPEGDGESLGSSCTGATVKVLASPRGEGGRSALERAHSKERLTAGKVPKAPPMMSRSAYLQYLKQQSQLRRLKAQQYLQDHALSTSLSETAAITLDSSATAATAATEATEAPATATATAAAASPSRSQAASRVQSAAASRRSSREPTGSHGLSAVIADPATSKVASCISSILRMAMAGDRCQAGAAAEASTAAAAGATGKKGAGADTEGASVSGPKASSAGATPGSRTASVPGPRNSSSVNGASKQVRSPAPTPREITSWGSGFGGDPHWSAVAAAAEAADAVLASSKGAAAAAAAAAATTTPRGTTAAPVAKGASAGASALYRVTEQSSKSGHSAAGASERSSTTSSSCNSGAAAAAAAAAAVAAVSAAAAAAEAKAAAAAANSLMGSLLYAEQVDAAAYASQRQPQRHSSQVNADPQQQQATAWEAQQQWLLLQQQQQQQRGPAAEGSADSAMLPKERRSMLRCPHPDVSMEDSAGDSAVTYLDEQAGPTGEELLQRQLLEQQQQAMWQEEQQRLKQQLLLEEEARRAFEAEMASTVQGSPQMQQQQQQAAAVAAATAPHPHPPQRRKRSKKGVVGDEHYWGAEEQMIRQSRLEHERQQLLQHEEQQRMLERQLADRRAMLQQWGKEQQALLQHYHMQQQLWEQHCRMQQQRYLQEQEAAWAEECRRQQKRRHRSHRRRYSCATSEAASTVTVSVYTDVCSRDGSPWELQGAAPYQHPPAQHVTGLPSPLSGRRG